DDGADAVRSAPSRRGTARRSAGPCAHEPLRPLVTEARRAAVRTVGLEGGRARLDARRPGRREVSPVLNADGVSVKGRSIIYAPKGEAGEYAALASNPYRGCGHRCKYCYVPRILRTVLAGTGATVAQARKAFDAGAVPRKDFLRKLR